jgi:DNA-binding CsgD family transcriptional regulator
VRYEDALESRDARVRLRAHALGAVAAIVPATVTFFVGVNRRHVISEAVALQCDRPDFSLAGEWRRYYDEAHVLDPFATGRVADTGATLLILADFDEDVRRPFEQYLASLGMGDRATMYLRIAGTVVAKIALIRSAELGRFTAAEAAALRRLQPLVQQAYACAAEPELRGLQRLQRSHGLTDREADVAGLISRGATNAEIARALHLGQATVKTHLTRIYAKVGVRSRTQLALRLASSG